MNAQEFLSRPYRANLRLEKAYLKAAALQSLTERVTARFGRESEPVSHSVNCTAMQDAIARLVEAKEEAERLKDELAAVELETGMVLARLSDETLYEFMVKRFLDLKSTRAAAEEMSYSDGWGRWEARRGVEEVQRILDEMEAAGECPCLPGI